MALDASRIPELVALICWWARQRGSALTTVQLVKYLYLADLYFARRNQGETITNWPWAFINFGPYCGEAMQAIDNAAGLGWIEREARESSYGDNEYYLHKALVREEPKLGSDLAWYVASGLKAAIKRWADDTGGLLDYVYFDTEPMRGIQPYDRLDFRRAELPAGPEKPPTPEKLPEKKLRKGMALLAALRERTLGAAQTTPIDTGPHDQHYFHAVDHDSEPVDDGTYVKAGVLGLDSPDGEGE